MAATSDSLYDPYTSTGSRGAMIKVPCSQFAATVAVLLAVGGTVGCDSCVPDHASLCPFGCGLDVSDNGSIEDATEVATDAAEFLDAAGCKVPCGDACCADGWKCGADEACYQCIKDEHCHPFEGCEGHRCWCNVAKLCELHSCDLDCPDWQHCEWVSTGMACVPDVCEPACAVGFRCVDDECQAYCDKACEDWQQCEWEGDAAMVCVDRPCDSTCRFDEHCDRAECVSNVCTGRSNSECADLGCVCLADGSCGACSGCEPPCDEGFGCEDLGGTLACVPLDDCPCPVGTHCVGGPGWECVPNVCELPCAVDCGEYCGADGVCVATVDCSAAPDEPVCGWVESGELGFQIFPNLCCLQGTGATVADCAELSVQPVCDVAGYVANPLGDNTYVNVCHAACAGVDVAEIQAGECACAMTCTADQLGYNPVCGTDCQDYLNPCAAQCADVGVLFPHLCPVDCGCCGSCSDCEDACPDPVCGTDGQTYASLCELELCHEGVELAYPGRCVPAGCACPATSEPVCGTVPGEEGWGTLPNPCTANCLDATVWFDFVCSCCDPTPEAPVCAYSPLTGWTSERNQCVVDSYGYYATSYPGACVCCDAPGSLDGCCDLGDQAPVCGVDGVTYANGCALDCAGVAKDHDGACVCASAWDPVCGESVLEPGKTYTYGNACVATSVYGVTSFTAGACAMCAVVCAEAPGDPVCGLDGVSYPDACYQVKCNGDAVQLHLDDTTCHGACESCP